MKITSVLILLGILFWFFSQNLLAKDTDGTVVNNSGGGSELALVYAFQNYDSIVRPCLNPTVCQLTSTEIEFLQLLLDNLAIEQQQPFKFLNFVNTETAIFKTRPELGAIIEWNKSLLWRLDPGDPDGKHLSYSLNDAVSWVTQAFTEHYPNIINGIKIAFSQKLGRWTEGKQSLFIPYQESLNLRYQILRRTDTDFLLLEDGFDVFLNMESIIEKEVGCSIAKLSLFSLSWSPNFKIDESPKRAIANGRLGWQCHGSTKKWKASIAIVSVILPETDLTGEHRKNGSRVRFRMINSTPEVLLSQVESFF